MKWVTAAFLGYVLGWLAFMVVWAIAIRFARSEHERRLPTRPVIWAASAAFIVIALSWAGFFRDVLPLMPERTEYDRPSGLGN